MKCRISDDLGRACLVLGVAIDVGDSGDCGIGLLKLTDRSQWKAGEFPKPGELGGRRKRRGIAVDEATRIGCIAGRRGVSWRGVETVGLGGSDASVGESAPGTDILRSDGAEGTEESTSAR